MDQQNSCSECSNKDYFRHGGKALFLHSAWLDGESPKDIAPAIFSASKKKNKKVQ
jgi:hypothetical protein